jgi:hypothetical protein
MANKKFSYIRGYALRVTKLDGCGNVVPGSLSSAVSEGIITVGISPQTEEGETIRVTNARGRVCVNDEPAPTLLGNDINATFCEVDATVFSLMTGQPLVYDDEDNIIGFDIESDIDLDASGFGLELWTGTPTDICEPGEEQSYGYLVVGFVKGGLLGDLSIENGAINFQITGAKSKNGTAWGVGPYDVVKDSVGAPSPMFTPLSSKNHLRSIVTTLPPPTDVGGAVPLGTEATGATEVEGGEATLTPANSYPPFDLVDAGTGFTASPGTAWDTGSFVTLEDGSIAHWDGTSWEEGEAP